MKRTWNILLLAASLMLVVGCESKTEDTTMTQAQQDRDDKIIIDDAYVLYDDEKLMKQYREFNDYLLETYDIDFRVITVSNEEDINLYANKAFTELQQKSRSKSGKALLLVINTLQDKVRLEVSQALEPVYTDAFVSYIERKGFVPYFRDYKIADGVYMATELVKDRALEATEGKEFMPPMESKSIGGGAKTKSYIGIADPDAKKGAQVEAHRADDPIAVLNKYIHTLKTHNKNPNLDIFTNTTKIFFTNRTVTDINMNNELRFLEPCMKGKSVKYSNDGMHAVTANEPYDKHRTCAPYFFKKENGAWKLDIATMAQTLRFNQPMQWHFDMKTRLQGEAKYYAFAFDGYAFDVHGYSHTPNGARKKPKDARWGFVSSAAWYEPGPSRLEVEKNPKKYLKAMIKYIYSGSYAETRLGLMDGDYIRDIEVNGKLYKNVLYDDFLRLMGEAKKGTVVKLFVKNHKGELKIREGIAP